jgi:hypothetical protein
MVGQQALKVQALSQFLPTPFAGYVFLLKFKHTALHPFGTVALYIEAPGPHQLLMPSTCQIEA